MTATILQSLPRLRRADFADATVDLCSGSPLFVCGEQPSATRRACAEIVGLWRDEFRGINEVGADDRCAEVFFDDDGGRVCAQPRRFAEVSEMLLDVHVIVLDGEKWETFTTAPADAELEAA